MLASIYHYLKYKKVERTGPKLEYLQQLLKGKECDKDRYCEEGYCDLLENRCVDDPTEDYYDNMQRRKVNGKFFLGTKKILDDTFGVEPEPEPEPKPKKAPEPKPKKAPKAQQVQPEDEAKEAKDTEEVDLDIDIKDLGKLTELQRALVECLMPAGK